MDINTLKTDGDLEKNGVWLNFGEDTRMRIASENSNAYKKSLRHWGRQLPRHLVADSPAAQEWIITRAMADAILLEHEGFTDKGTPIGNTVEDRRMLLGLPPIRDFVSQEMQRLSNHQKAANAAEDTVVKEQ